MADTRDIEASRPEFEAQMRAAGYRDDRHDTGEYVGVTSYRWEGWIAALASRPAEVDDDTREWFVVGGRRVGRTFMANLARDAARYRWLRESSNIEAVSIVDLHSAESMDARVDGAMLRAAGDGSAR